MNFCENMTRNLEHFELFSPFVVSDKLLTTKKFRLTTNASQYISKIIVFGKGKKIKFSQLHTGSSA